MVKEWEELTEEDRRALRGSKFAPLPAPPSSSRKQPRFAHPGGPLATNKAAALAKFLERKLQEPGGLASINPALVERAVKNAKDTVNASGSSSSNSGKLIRHVSSFADSQDPDDEEEDEGESQVKAKDQKPKKQKKKKKKKKKKMEDPETTTKSGKPKKKLKL